MILLIDNYDSFSYNLYQLIGEIDPNIKVIRNDEMTVDEIKELTPDRMILSPGPGRPEDAGMIVEAVKILGKEIPILGVCLGHQAICAAFGSTITYAKERMHGKQSDVKFDINCPLFVGCPETAFQYRRVCLPFIFLDLGRCMRFHRIFCPPADPSGVIPDSAHSRNCFDCNPWHCSAF